MKQPTMKDVARMAGVSQPTVSHVINGTAPISEAVKNKVNEAIRELGYVPSVTAKNLKSHKSNIIGLIVPDVSIRFYSELVKVIETALRKKGYMIFLCNTFYNENLEREYIETLIQHNVLGVISGANLQDEMSYRLLESNNIPVTLLDTVNDVDWMFSVKIDNRMIARMAVSHLYNIGARNICYISEPFRNTLLQLRYEYFQQALAEFGLSHDENICFIGQYQYDNFSKLKMGYNLAANIMLNSKIDGVFASSDEFAFGVIRRLKEHGVQIPQQVPIMGCDNDPFSALISPSLTTIWQPINQMAEIGVQRLLRLINGETPEQKSMKLEPNIIIRESTMKIGKTQEG